MKTLRSFLFGSLILLILPLIASDLYGQPPDSLWQRHYGGSGDDQGFDAIEGHDGNEFIVIGKTKSYGNGGYDAYILKLDAEGNVKWEKSYGGAGQEQIVSICPALYGGYVVTGYTSTIAAGISDAWLMWINEDGDSLWTKTYGGESADNGLYISTNIDQGYIVSATYGTGFSMGDQIWLMKLDVAGDTIWTRIFGGPGQDYGEEVIQTSDGGYIIAGRTYATPYPESCDALVIKTDLNGDTIWTRKYGGSDEDMFNCVVETDDGYIFAGTTHSFGPGYYACYAVRTDDKGDTLWTRTYGGSSVNLCFNISEKNNGNYVLIGYSDSFSPSDDTYLIEIDIDGNLVWERNYGNPDGDEIVYGGHPTSDGGFIVTGRTNYYPAMMDEIFVLKLGPPNSGNAEPAIPEQLNLTITPNPVHQTTNISFKLPGRCEVFLALYNQLGKMVKSFIEGGINAGKQEITFDVSDFPPGVYYLKLSVPGNQAVKKIVIGG